MELGFIILRCVKTVESTDMWSHCYDCIRKYYPENKIVIIDDNSDYKLIKSKKLYKTQIIQSEYPGRGELLPYYYYLQNKLFDKAVLLHDSAFINKKIDTNVNNYKFLWEFEHYWDLPKYETEMIDIYNNLELKTFYEDKSKWKGCFGCMCIITHDYIVYINKKYAINKLLDYVKTRIKRCAFERVIACILQKHSKKETLLGNINKYCDFGEFGYNDIHKLKHLPIIKVWSGR